MTDQLQRFLFDDTDVRGELVCLEKSYQDTLLAHDYPPLLQQLLGEFLAAVSLLSATIKFDGTLTLQARGEGQLSQIMAEIVSGQKLRAIARYDEDFSGEIGEHDLGSLLSNGQLCITIDPLKGQRYQGIVPLEGSSLAQCLEAYFEQSEQLSTRVWLNCSSQRAAGMLLQEMPAASTEPQEPSTRAQRWQHITALAETLTSDELLNLPFSDLLYRLYHQDQVRLFEPTSLRFECSCSRGRTLSALQTLGQAELTEILQESGTIEINCEFCHRHYIYSEADIQTLFNPTQH